MKERVLRLIQKVLIGLCVIALLVFESVPLWRAVPTVVLCVYLAERREQQERKERNKALLVIETGGRV